MSKKKKQTVGGRPKGPEKQKATFYLRQDLLEQFHELAAETGHSLIYHVERALAKYLDEQR
jgi:predicted transcriptional regulator